MKQVSANPVLAQCYVYEQASTSGGKKSCICEVILFSKLSFVFSNLIILLMVIPKGRELRQLLECH